MTDLIEDDVTAVVRMWAICSCGTDDTRPSTEPARNTDILEYCNAVGHHQQVRHRRRVGCPTARRKTPPSDHPTCMHIAAVCLAPSVCVFLFVCEISRKPLNGFVPNSQGRRVSSLPRMSSKVKVKSQRSRSLGTKRYFRPFGGLRAVYLW